MTLSDRNVFFKAGIALSAVCTLLVLYASFELIPAYASMDAENTRRAEGLVQALVSRFLKINFYAVHASVAAVVVYSLVSIILIYYYFEKTQVPQILFVAFFSISLSFEAIRLILPFHLLHEVPSLYLNMASRALLFGRYFGLFSLFAASVLAAGLDLQKYRNIILLILASTLIIALGVSIDTQTWDASLSMINGYTSLFRLIEAAVLFTTVASFLIAANVRSSKEYIVIGIGALLALVGRNMLLSADTWLSPAPGLACLCLGTWFITSRLHKIYLWL